MESLLSRLRGGSAQFSSAAHSQRHALLETAARAYPHLPVKTPASFIDGEGRAQLLDYNIQSLVSDEPLFAYDYLPEHVERIIVSAAAVPPMMPFRPSNALVASAARAARGESMAIIGALATGVPVARSTFPSVRAGSRAQGHSMALRDEAGTKGAVLDQACAEAANAALWPRGLFADLNEKDVIASKIASMALKTSSGATEALSSDFRKVYTNVGLNAVARAEAAAAAAAPPPDSATHAAAALGLATPAVSPPALRDGFSSDTVAEIATLRAFRAGLQVLEANRRRANAVLQREPSAFAASRAALPTASLRYSSPYAA
jgi:hypothetical protein